MTKACVAVVVVAAAAAAAAVASAARVSSQARCRSHSLCVSVRSCRPSSSWPVWPCDAVSSRDSSPRVYFAIHLRFTYLRDFVTVRASQDTKCMSHEKLICQPRLGLMTQGAAAAAGQVVVVVAVGERLSRGVYTVCS